MRKLSAAEALKIFQKYQKYIIAAREDHLCAATDSSLITLEFILENWHAFPWHISTLFQRKDWTLEKLKWYLSSQSQDWPSVDWDAMTCSEGITIDNILDNPNFSWSKDTVMNNPNLEYSDRDRMGDLYDHNHDRNYELLSTEQDVLLYEQGYELHIRHTAHLKTRSIADMTDDEIWHNTDNERFNYDDIMNNKERKWDISRIMCNPNYTEKWDNIYLEFGYIKDLSYTASMNTIINNPSIEWHMVNLSDNSNITWDFIFSKPEWNWNLFRYTVHHTTTVEALERLTDEQLMSLYWSNVCKTLSTEK